MSPLRSGLALLLASVCGCGGSGEPSPLAAAAAQEALFAPAVAFGAVEVGANALATLVIRNPAGGSEAMLTAIVPSSGEFALGAGLPALPHRLAAGGQLAITASWSPAVAGFLSASVEVRVEGRDALQVEVSGTGFLPNEIVTDFGLVLFEPGTKRTPELSVELPADAISLSIEATGSRTNPSGGPIFLEELLGPGGKVYVDAAAPHAGPYRFERNLPFVSVNGDGQLPTTPVDLAMFVLPNSDDPAAQLVAGGGNYRFRLSNDGGTVGGLFVRAFVERRDSGTTARGRLDLNVFLGNALIATAQSAPTDPHVQTILGRADELLRQTGLGLGDIDYYDVTNPAFDTVDPNDPGPIVALSSAATEVRVNVFLVKSLLFGAAGISASLPGPKLNGTQHSGLALLADEFFHPVDLGTILAHEICHYLGLGHTREAAGAAPWTTDLILDTCPGPACVGTLDEYLMDFTGLPTRPPVLTPGQAHVILRHPLVAAGSPTFVPGASFPALAGRARPPAGCATCGR